MIYKKKLQKKYGQKGFTLIEVVVSLTLFIVVMVVAAGALVSIIDADRKSDELKAVIDNLNFALDDMVRSVRVGNVYTCGPAVIFSEVGTSTGSFDNTGDQFDRSGIDASPNCPSPASSSDVYNKAFEFTDNSGIQTVYYLGPNDTGGNSIFASQYVSGAWTVPQQYTADQVDISDMRFYVIGATPGPSDGQPYVLITIDGFAGEGKYRSTFNLQTSVTQRLYDI